MSERMAMASSRGSGPSEGAFSAGPLAHHVLGVPVRPVRVGLARARLVLAVGGRGAAQRLCQVARGGVGRAARDARRRTRLGWDLGLTHDGLLDVSWNRTSV